MYLNISEDLILYSHRHKSNGVVEEENPSSCKTRFSKSSKNSYGTIKLPAYVDFFQLLLIIYNTATTTTTMNLTQYIDPPVFRGESISSLHPGFITGFLDAEWNFYIKIVKSSTITTGYSVQLTFGLILHAKDLALLRLIQAVFNGVGNI